MVSAYSVLEPVVERSFELVVVAPTFLAFEPKHSVLCLKLNFRDSVEHYSLDCLCHVDLEEVVDESSA